jgi:predicted aspartyl protease
LQKFEVVVDTGYSGNLCINKELAKMLNLEYVGKVRNLNVDNKVSLDDLYKLKIEFPNLDLKSTKFNITATAKANMLEEMIIGQKLLNLFASSNDLALVLNYQRNEIYFSKEG